MSKRKSTRVAAKRPRELVAGFKLFFVCVLLAGIIGSAVRLYFSPLRIEKFIRAQIEKQNLPYKIDFRAARLVLARGLLPTFAIDVLDVKVSHFAPCMTEPFVEAGILILPVDWFKLMTGHIQLGVVIADGVSMSADRAKCSQQSATASSSQLPPAAQEREPQQIKSWFKTEDLERVKKAIAGVEIQNGTIYFDNSKKFVQVTYLVVWHKGEAVMLDGKVVLPAELTYNELFPPLTLKGSISQDLAELDARNSFNEGGLEASIKLVPTENPQAPQARVLFRAGAMPLSIFSGFLRKLGVLSNSKLQPKFMWLNCDVTSEGPLPKLLSQTPLKVDNCMVEGDAGRIDIGPAMRTSDGEWLPFDINIRNFNIEDLLRTFGEKGPSGVLSSFGILKGKLSYESKYRQTFDGSIEESEIYFSNRNVRAYQKIESINIQASRVDDNVSGKIFKVVLSPGKVAGQVTFAFDKRFESGNMDFDTRELSLDPKIEKLMTDGIFESLALKGQLNIREHKIANWTGQVQAASYTGSQMKIVKPVADTNYSRGRFDMTAQALSGELSPGSKWLGWIKRAAPDIKINSASDKKWIPISNIKSQISIEQGLVGWKNATITASQSKVQVTSTGEIKNNKSATGLLTTVEPGAKNRKFIISGSAQSPTLTPRD